MEVRGKRRNQRGLPTIWLAQVSEDGKPRRGQRFRWRRQVNITSSVCNMYIKVSVKHPCEWSHKQWLERFPITTTEIAPDTAAQSSGRTQKSTDGGGEELSPGSKVPLALRHNLDIASWDWVTVREAPESAERATTMAKALPRGVHQPFILPPITPSLLPPLGLLGNTRQLDQRSA